MSRVAEITNFSEQESFIANNERAVLFFGSERCGHCRNMVPVIERMTTQYPSVAFGHVEVTRVKVDNVNGVPVFVNYLRKVPVNVIIGASPQELTSAIETNLLPY